MNTKLRCYYEVLGIEKSAKQDEIKISYRKLALMWHPDKNQHQLSIAEEKFKEINNAYTVLSDPNERKWYDDHREAILRGGRGGSGDGDDDDDEINLWPYFNTSIFTSFNDNDETGFFKIYSRIFEIIDKIEEGEETVNEYHHHPPKFGDSTTPIAEVLKFYSFWKDFVTKKKFTSSDLYHLSDAPNRQIKRLMEKENQKERSKARSAYNERVRHLASFIYNHDKRITEYQKKCLEETERKQREAAIQKQLDEEERQKQIKKFKEEKQREYQLAKQQGLYKDDDDNLYQDNSNNSNFCIICDKAFKSEGQLENHQNSNKHKQELARIRKAVSLDDELLPEDNSNSNNNNNSNNSSNNNTNGNDSNEDDDEDDEDNNKNKKSKKSKKAKKKSKKVINSQMFNEKSDEFVFGLVNKNKKKSKPQKFIESEEEKEEEEENLKENKDLSNDDDDDNLNSEDEDDLLVTSMLKNFVLTKEKKKNLKEQREKEEKENEVQDDDDDENESEQDSNDEDREDDDFDEEDEEDEEEDGDKKVKKDNKKDNKKNTTTTTTTTTSKSKGKAKEKREKKEEKKQQQQQQQQGQTGGESLFCNVCKGEFPSRNKLFQHIKETKHAQAVPSSGVSSGNKKKK
ncbi:hypothetical protein ACTFIW_012838 [Dictyostelium discoideum]